MTDPIFTIEDVLDRVRKLKSDATYSTTDLRLWVYDALMELYTQAPKTRLDDEEKIRDLPDAFTADTDTVPCSVKYMPLIVDYVLARALMQDADSQEHAARADKFFNLFFQRAHWIQHGPVQFNDRTLAPARERS